MIIYIQKDEDPVGGYFAFGPQSPDIRYIAPTVTEIRVVDDGGENLWERFCQAELPAGIDGTYDSLLLPYWKKGDTVWTKE